MTPERKEARKRIAVAEIDAAIKRQEELVRRVLANRHAYLWSRAWRREEMQELALSEVRILRDQRWIQLMVIRGYGASLGL
jgi:hypothetical protein